jgi:hypothetical protein
MSVYFTIGNTLPKPGTFLLGHPVYVIDGRSERYGREARGSDVFSGSSVVLVDEHKHIPGRGLEFISHLARAK